jgi:hypothetical protein
MIAPWATEEVENADLGDERLDARLELLLSALGSRPNLSIPAACGGRAEMQAAYRFFDNDKVTFEKVLRPHAARTLQRLAGHPAVLLVQDTAEIELTRPGPAVAGAGELDGPRRGFLLHDMQAFTPEGTPPGTVWAEVVNRAGGVSHAPAPKKERRRKHTPIEGKETMRWLAGLRQARAVAGRVPGARCVCVADSEADVYELFAEPRGEPPVDWLVRACQDRALQEGPGPHLRERVLSTPVLYEVDLLARGREAKTGAESRARRQSRESRRARVEVRAAPAALRPPWRFDRELPPVTANAVLVSEPGAPAGEPPVEWLLLTTLPIDTPEQVREVVSHYCVRWQIEVLFRVLKSGCRVERRRFEHVERVMPCLAPYLIVAWRTMFVCRMGRECPDLGCEAIFEPSEWKAVRVAVHGEEPPKKAPPLAAMVHLIARLGGYVERPRGAPGAQTLWIGLQRMYDLAWGWDSFGPGSKHRGRSLV